MRPKKNSSFYVQIKKNKYNYKIYQINQLTLKIINTCLISQKSLLKNFYD